MELDSSYLGKFEDSVHNMLAAYLYGKRVIDKILPDTTDIESKWEKICESYLPDGVREFTGYPTVSLGWMMFIGMAMAKMWDADWKKLSKDNDVYKSLRDARGYDCMDEYICQDVLGLDEAEQAKVTSIVGDAATIAYKALMQEGFEPSTPTAFNAYVRCLHQLYYFGAAAELNRLGYHMVEVPLN